MQRLNQYIITNSSQSENAYGRFAEHILISEGLMGFTRVDLANEDLPRLAATDLIVVTRCFLRRVQVERLLEAVRVGARVVFLQPQRLVVEQLGFAASANVTYPSTVRIREGWTSTQLPLQTHLPIPRYHLPEGAGWQIIADALDADWNETGFPAVVKAAYGQGEVTLFFYDLAEAIARIRFGNPDLSGYSTNGVWDWPHALDLFVGHVDHRVAHLPQADLHAQLFARILTETAPYPLARLWYYEDTAQRTVGVFQSDGDLSEPDEFRRLAAAIEKRDGKATFYLMRATKLSESDVAAFRARGHTFAPHVDPLARGEELYFALPDGLKEETKRFAARFGAVSPTLQCHCAPWPSYMSMVPAHIENGYRLLFAYLPAPATLWGKYICGSGRPITFCGREGTMYGCRQQPLVLMDDASLIPFLRDEADTARNVFDATLKAALEQSHTAMPILSHPVSFCGYSSPVMEHAFDRLHEVGAPIYNADAWLHFLDWREAMRVSHEENDSLVSYAVAGLQGRIPLMFPMKKLGSDTPAVLANGKNATYTIHRRFGEDYLFLQLDAKEHGSEVSVNIR